MTSSPVWYADPRTNESDPASDPREGRRPRPNENDDDALNELIMALSFAPSILHVSSSNSANVLVGAGTDGGQRKVVGAGLYGTVTTCSAALGCVCCGGGTFSRSSFSSQKIWNVNGRALVVGGANASRPELGPACSGVEQ